MPYGKGSTGWSGHFHSAAIAGFSPAGWIFSSMDSRCGVATAALEIPAVMDFPPDTDVFSIGDWVELDGTTGDVIITKKISDDFAFQAIITGQGRLPLPLF